jgi:hypothetical protein
MRSQRVEDGSSGFARVAATRVTVTGVLPFAFVLCLAAGCTPAPAPGTMPAPRGTPSETVRPGSRTPVTAVVDSGPSSDASAVLETIPEPLKPSERVPPPARGALMAPDSSGVARASSDSAEVADSTRTQVPVPSPTMPLGDRTSPVSAAPPPVVPPPSGTSNPSGAVSPPASAGPQRSEAPKPSSSPAPMTPAPGGSTQTPATRDTCWRVQVGAPAEKEKAEQVRSAAESVLMIPMVVEFEANLFKVRTRGCMDRGAADQMRARALASGFVGSFRLIWKAP